MDIHIDVQQHQSFSPDGVPLPFPHSFPLWPPHLQMVRLGQTLLLLAGREDVSKQ